MNNPDPSSNDIVLNGQKLTIEKLATGFCFTEGPAWHSEGFLLFSDTPANKIYKLYHNGTTDVFADNSGWDQNDGSLLSDMAGSNGLAIDNNGAVLICQHGNHCIARKNTDAAIEPIASKYNNRPFNSPNDLIVTPEGIIYFTDPPYGLKGQELIPGSFQPIAGVYCLQEGIVSLLCNDFNYPNGLCLSPDGSSLFVSSNHPDEPLIRKYSFLEPDKVHPPTIFSHQNADGIKLDRSGNLFAATGEGIKIISSTGEVSAIIPLPEEPTNMAWGGMDQLELYITARKSIYRVKGFSE